MNLPRLLCEGVGSWLHFEAACDRSGLFSEKYLATAVGQILAARAGGRVNAEFTHPVLEALRKGAGRPPQIDFVYCEPPAEPADATKPPPPDKTRLPLVAVETKWTGRTRVLVADIIWDLIRLEMIASTNPRATCIFLLGGKRMNLDALFASDDFTGGSGLGVRHPVLRTTNNRQLRLDLLPQHPYRHDLLRRLFKSYQTVPIPHRLWTTRVAPFPPDVPNDQYQIYAWRVNTEPNRKTFEPRDIFYYRVRKY